MPIDRVFGGIVCLLSVTFMLFGVPTISDEWQRDAGAQYFTVGPRLFPYLAGTLCLFFGALIALWPRESAVRNAMPDRRAVGRVLGLMALGIAYCLLLEPFGFVLASAAMLLVFMLAFGVRSPVVLIGIAVAVPVVVDIVFAKLLVLFLPRGILDLAF